MTASAASISALLLLALAGGFLFAGLCEYTRYPSLRGEGQQLYFFAAVFAVLLIFVSRAIIAVGTFLIPAPIVNYLNNLWVSLGGPLHSEALFTFFVAFWLGPIAAWLINLFSDSEQIARKVITNYGGQMERFIYDAILERRLIFVTLSNGKVYVGWPTNVPHPKPRREDLKEHFKLLPARSGYLNEKLEPIFTTEYQSVYSKILRGNLQEMEISDFQIVIPLDEVVVLRTYSLSMDQKLFELS